jgi:hypothetical protein
MKEVKIELINGKFFVNGKHDNLTYEEINLLNAYFRYFKEKTEN